MEFMGSQGLWGLGSRLCTQPMPDEAAESFSRSRVPFDGITLNPNLNPKSMLNNSPKHLETAKKTNSTYFRGPGSPYGTGYSR